MELPFKVKERSIIVQKTARYFTYGNIAKAKFHWICCHGYGQLAEYFIRNFDFLHPDDHFVVAPEGLHRFYLQNSTGRVGASWMTKEARESDIRDYLNFMEAVYIDSGLAEYNRSLIAFGFSQGVATLSRWIAHTKAPIGKALFWAGSFPPDLATHDVNQHFSHLPTYCFTGNQDEFISPDSVEIAKQHFQNLGLHPAWITFDGGHVIEKSVLNSIVQQWNA